MHRFQKGQARGRGSPNGLAWVNGWQNGIRGAKRVKKQTLPNDTKDRTRRAPNSVIEMK